MKPNLRAALHDLRKGRYLAETLDLNFGLVRIIEEISGSESHPVIVSLYGNPNSGKTYLIDKVGRHFEKLALITRQRENPHGLNFYESWAPWKSQTKESLISEMKGFDLIMFHCPWEKSSPWKDRLNPEELLGRLDLSVGVYNPKLNNKPKGFYDFIIANPDSVDCPWWVGFDD